MAMFDPWNDPAPTCGHCHQEAFRLLDGLCPRCSEGRDVQVVEEAEDKAVRAHFKRALRAGTVSLQELREGRL